MRSCVLLPARRSSQAFNSGEPQRLTPVLPERPDGRLIIVGADAEPLTISLMGLISKRIRVIGSQQNGPEYLYEALDFVAQGKVKTIVETHPLADAPKAYQRVVEGKARFRAVLTM